MLATRIKRTVLFILRLGLTFVAMLLAYILSTMVIGQNSVTLTPEEASQAGIALNIVSQVNALVISFLIMRSHWYGVKLIGALILIYFGVETFMAQIETLYFNEAVQMGPAELIGIVAAGGLRALIFIPLAVLIHGKIKKPLQQEVQKSAISATHRGWRFIFMAVFYVVIYFTFGYFVAWQWEETRLYYSGTTAIKPFFTHFWDLFVKEDPAILPFQLMRGALWAFLVVAIVRMLKTKRWESSLATASTFAVLLALPIGLFPNPYMPPMVRQAHFYELFSSMLVYGGVAGWVMDQATS